MKNTSPKNQLKNEGPVSPGFLLIMKGFALLALLITICVFSFKPKAHHAPVAQTIETNQASEVSTNTLSQVEAVVEPHDPMELALNDFGFSTNDVTPIGVTAELKEPILVKRK